MISELEVLKQRITELEAENIKLKAEKAEVEARNAELIKQMMEENNRRDARIAKLEQKQLQNDNTRNDNPSNNASTNFNSDAEQPQNVSSGPSIPANATEVEDDRLSFLIKDYKKRRSEEIRQRYLEKMQRESANQNPIKFRNYRALPLKIRAY